MLANTIFKSFFIVVQSIPATTKLNKTNHDFWPTFLAFERVPQCLVDSTSLYDDMKLHVARANYITIFEMFHEFDVQ